MTYVTDGVERFVESVLSHQKVDLGSSFGSVRTTCFLIQAYSMEGSVVVGGKGLIIDLRVCV